MYVNYNRIYYEHIKGVHSSIWTTYCLRLFLLQPRFLGMLGC